MKQWQAVYAWAERVAAGERLETVIWERLLAWPEDEVWGLLPATTALREWFCGSGVHLCTICNAKSGGCSEDCGFCAQSQSARGTVPSYPLQAGPELVAVGQDAAKNCVHRFAAVTAGRGLPEGEAKTVAAALSALPDSGIGTCASLGIISEISLKTLREAGVRRYHHNLETARGYFPKVCTTHSYEDRVAMIERAKAAGFSICSGGIFGMGETDAHVVELGRALEALGVDAVPINFFVPLEGTRLAAQHNLTPLRCLKIIALLRFLLPRQDLIVCGGREYNLRELHPFIFQAGANGIMTGNYLTTTGRTPAQDRAMIADLGLHERASQNAEGNLQ